jgi:hypothetical protein
MVQVPPFSPVTCPTVAWCGFFAAGGAAGAAGVEGEQAATSPVARTATASAVTARTRPPRSDRDGGFGWDWSFIFPPVAGVVVITVGIESVRNLNIRGGVRCSSADHQPRPVGPVHEFVFSAGGQLAEPDAVRLLLVRFGLGPKPGELAAATPCAASAGAISAIWRRP